MPDQMANPSTSFKPEVHWSCIARAMLPAALIAFVISIAPALPILWVLFLPCVPPFVYGMITFFFTDIELNQQRLVCGSGLFTRQTLDLPLARIESVQMKQSLLGRIMNYGQVTIIAIGSSPIMTPSIKQPAMFREALQLAVSQHND